MTLKSLVVEKDKLNDENIKKMFSLMNDVYDGENIDKFKKDLSKKNYVLLLFNVENNIVGFTTIQVFDFEGYKIIYSGDTVIEENSRGDIELMRAWWRFSYKIQTQYPKQKVLWLLISKGWKTYKFLPMFLEKFYPSRKNQTPANIQEFINRLSIYKFGDDYKNGLVISKNTDKLKIGKNDVSKKRKNDLDVQFFLQKNPKFYDGDELVCIAELSYENLTKVGRRLLHGEHNEQN